MIIGLAGRKKSGKTTVANILEARNFKKASFADKLKECLSKLYDWDINLLYTQQGKESLLDKPVLWNKNFQKKLGDMVNLTILDEERTFVTIRDALQYIGTDVLRKIDNDFHVKEFQKKYSDGNFVCDDLRFPNELATIRRMDGTGIFIFRPYFWDYSNHESEISLSRKDFEYVFINDRSEHMLIRKMSMCFDSMLIKSNHPINRNNLIDLLENNNWNTEKAAQELGCSRDKIVWWTTKHMVHIPRSRHTINHDVFFTPSKISAYWAGVLSGDGTIKKHQIHDYLLELTSTDLSLIEGFRDFICPTKTIYSRLNKYRTKPQHSITISSQFAVEDLKLWNLEPRKSKRNKIPDCIKNNDELLSYWLVGLIDSDGSIYLLDKGKNICINMLASKQIIDFIYQWLGFNGGSISQEKKIDNLFNLRFTGRRAVALYNKIYRGVGLSRKWDKMKPFLNKQWYARTVNEN